MDCKALLGDARQYARIDFDDDDETLLLMLAAAAADVAHAAGTELPEDAGALPGDLRLAILDQAAMLFDARGGVTERDRPRGLSLAASRICARHRGVSLGGQGGGDGAS